MAVVAPVGNFVAGVGEDEEEVEQVVEVEELMEVEKMVEKEQPLKRRKRNSEFRGEVSRFEVGEGSGWGRGGGEEEVIPRSQRRPPVVKRTPVVERGGGEEMVEALGVRTPWEWVELGVRLALVWRGEGGMQMEGALVFRAHWE